MEEAPDEMLTVSSNGSIPLSRKLRQRWGLKAGSRVVVRQTSIGLMVYPEDLPLGRVVIEPTTACNLNCRSCMRHSWSDPIGYLEMSSFRRLIQGLRLAPSLHTVSFWGMGEPLMHPEIVEMVAEAARLGTVTELITNGMLLTPDKAAALIEAGLSRLVVSIDGVTPTSNASNRTGSNLDRVRGNLAELRRLRRSRSCTNPEIGIEFVLMRRNIGEIRKLRGLAFELGARFIILTNVLPYTEKLKDEILYRLGAGRPWSRRMSTYPPEISIPRIDARPESLSAINDLLWSGYTAEPIQKRHRNPDADGHCSFVEQGSAVISWDGGVSPCVALMHAYRCYVLDREKTIHRYTLGNIDERNILDIWHAPEFEAFRNRLLAFDFPPCIHCGGCDYIESNEGDCFGNPFPVCGDCLWAQNVIVCL